MNLKRKMMDTLYIKQLLDKYFAAETTKDEERKLSAYFNQPDIDSELLPYATLFRQFCDESKLKAPAGADSKLREIQLIETRKRRTIRQNISLGIAAGLLLLLSIGLFNNHNDPATDNSVFIMYINGERVDDPVAAMEFTTKQLEIISGTFNKAGEVISAPINSVNESLTPLKKTRNGLSKIEEILNIKPE